MTKVGLPVRKEAEHFTYRDYRSWPDDERWELIGGVAYNMCAAPSLNHQESSGALFVALRTFLKGKSCRVFAAPVDVFFPSLPDLSEDEVDTVVQPDIVVVCDPAQLRPNGVWGAPDLVAEILSPTTSRKDLHEKYDLYQRSGVKEYWVLDPVGRWLQQYVLRPDGRYAPELTLEGSATVASVTLPGFALDLSMLWADLI